MQAASGAVIGGLSVSIALAIWWGISALINPVRFPRPDEFIAAAIQIARDGYAGGTLLSHILQSMKLALFGFLVAIGTAIPIGLAMGCSKTIAAIVGPIVSFIRPIPPLAWIPLAIIWFGLGDGAKIFVIWFTAFVPTLINTLVGIRTLDPTMLAAARVHGAGGARMLFDVILPGSAPLIFVGLRVSLQASWMALVAAELIGAFFGLGRVLMTAAQDIFPAMIVVAMVAVAASGAIMTYALGLIERRCLRWAETASMSSADTHNADAKSLSLTMVSTASIVVAIGAWFALAQSGLLPKLLLPSPLDVASAMQHSFGSAFAGATLPQHLAASLVRFFAGFVLAVALGIPFGLLLGWVAPFRHAASPFFEAFRFIAPLAWVPFAALWFGVGIGGPILIVFSGAFSVCVVNTYRGARLTDPRLIEACRTMGAGSWRLLVDVMLPSAMPAIMAGVRIAAALGWQSLIGAELIVASSGIGYLIVQGQSSIETPIVMAGMVTIGCVGLTIDWTLQFLGAQPRRIWMTAS